MSYADSTELTSDTSTQGCPHKRGKFRYSGRFFRKRTGICASCGAALPVKRWIEMFRRNGK